MTNLTYKRGADGTTCITQCPYGEDRMVGSLACNGCRHHYLTMPGLGQVICRYNDNN